MLETDVGHDCELELALGPVFAGGRGPFPPRSPRAFQTAMRGLVAALLCFLPAAFLRAQGTLDYVVLQTGSGQPLVSAEQVLQTGGVSNPALFLDFGFYSEETLTPAVFLDSFTITMQDHAMATAVIVTVDASGVLWAPFSPGAVILSDSDMDWTIIVPPSLQPILGRGIGFSLRVSLPAQFAGPTVKVYFDLFDNLDETMSLGWYRNPHIAPVPEPQSGWLCALGLGVLLIFRKRRQRNEVLRA